MPICGTWFDRGDRQRQPPGVDASGIDPSQRRDKVLGCLGDHHPLDGPRPAGDGQDPPALGDRTEVRGSVSRPPRDLSGRLGRSSWHAAGGRGGGIRRIATRSRAGGPGRRRDAGIGIGPPGGIDFPGDVLVAPAVVSSPKTDADEAGDRKAASGVAGPSNPNRAPRGLERIGPRPPWLAWTCADGGRTAPGGPEAHAVSEPGASAAGIERDRGPALGDPRPARRHRSARWPDRDQPTSTANAGALQGGANAGESVCCERLW